MDPPALKYSTMTKEVKFTQQIKEIQAHLLLVMLTHLDLALF